MRTLRKTIGKITCVILSCALTFTGCGDTGQTSTAETSISETESKTSEKTNEESTVSTSKETASVSEIQASTESFDKEEEIPMDIVTVNVDKKTLPESEALDFVESLGAGWILGNTFDANDAKGNNTSDLNYETYWQNSKTDKQMITDIREAGFTTIRIPVSWHNHVDSEFNISSDWMNRVKEVVDWAFEEDLKVIINIHHDNETEYMYPSSATLENSKKYVTRIWTQIATVFGDYDENLVFETLNEPRLKDTSEEWWVSDTSQTGLDSINCINELNQVIVDTIRTTEGEYNSSRYIMCPGYCASPEYALKDTYKLPTDTYGTKENRILVSVHSYTPYNFALNQDASQAVSSFSMYNSEQTNEITSFMARLYSKYISNGIGVVIGEFGSVDRDNLSDRVTQAAYYVANARSYGMSCIWWDNNNMSGSGEEFTIYDRANHEFLYPEIVSQLVYYGNK